MTPWAIACQVPLSMEFSRQESWSGLPFLFPGDLPHPGIKLASPAILSYIVVQWPSGVRLFATPWTAAHLASLSFIISQSLLKLMYIELVMASNHLTLYCPLLLLPSIFPSIRVFSSESVLCIRWPKYWSFSLSISPSTEYSELISFRIDWLDLLSVQGVLRSLLQHTSKASVLWHSAFFIVPKIIQSKDEF